MVPRPYPNYTRATCNLSSTVQHPLIQLLQVFRFLRPDALFAMSLFVSASNLFPELQTICAIPSTFDFLSTVRVID